MNNQDEQELIKLAKVGDASAFETLVERSYMFVYKTAFHWCKIKEDAEDITQEVFVKLARKIYGFKGSSQFQSWLYRMTINTAKDYVKKRQRDIANQAVFAEHEKLKTSVNQKEATIGDKIHQLIEKFPKKQKETAFLVFYEGLNHKEAAKALDCAETTISWRVFQMKKKLKQHLEYGEAT